MPTLTDADLPPLYHAADRTSCVAQRWFLTATRTRLLSLLGAAFFGLFSWHAGASPTDWAGVLATFCFALALLVEGYLLKTALERTWYEGRAAAESAKTLTWRYAVGGEPFDKLGTLTEAETDNRFLDQLSGLLTVLKSLDAAPPAATGHQISPAMRSVRALSLPERKNVYERARVEDQQGWYANKARWNKTRGDYWTMAMFAVEAAGMLAAILKAVGSIEGDMLGFAGAIVAAMLAWLQTKQHRALSAAYSVTSLELATLCSKIGHQTTEDAWAKFVNDAEEAFSREHTLWKASRGVNSL